MSVTPLLSQSAKLAIAAKSGHWSRSVAGEEEDEDEVYEDKVYEVRAEIGTLPGVACSVGSCTGSLRAGARRGVGGPIGEGWRTGWRRNCLLRGSQQQW